MKIFYKSVLVFIITILVYELFLYFIFGSPLRFYYQLSKEKIDLQTDFNVKYSIDWKTGYRPTKCQNNNPKNKKTIFIGDSFVFGQGVEHYENFVSLYSCYTNENVINLGSIGIGLDEYEQIIYNYDLTRIGTIYLIFYDNDYKIDYSNNVITKVKKKLRYRSFLYLTLRKFKNFIPSLFKKDKIIKYKDYVNNPANTFYKDSNELKNYFEKNEDKDK